MFLVNGEIRDHINITDRGLQYGDGLFETIAVFDGKLRLWERHWQRLSSGCRRLGIEGIDPRELYIEAERVCSDIKRGVLKMIITRGTSGRGYGSSSVGKATRIMAIYPWPTYPDTYWQHGVSVRVCSTRMGRNTVLAGMKHLNRLEQVMARREWDDPEIVEGLMLDDSDYVISGTMSNLFIVNDKGLMTPALADCGVEGIMRGVILDLSADLGIYREEAPLSLQHLLQASEIFLCNALIGIWPVRRIDQQDYSIGAITSLLGKRLNELLQVGKI